MIPSLSQCLGDEVTINLTGEAGAAIPPHSSGLGREELGDCADAHCSGAPSGLSRGRSALAKIRHFSPIAAISAAASQAKPLLTIAVQALCGVAFLYLIIFAFGAVA